MYLKISIIYRQKLFGNLFFPNFQRFPIISFVSCLYKTKTKNQNVQRLDDINFTICVRTISLTRCDIL